MPLSYTVREGLAGFRRARLATFTAVSALVVALVLVAVFALLGWQGRQALVWLKQRVGEVQVFLADATEAEHQRLGVRLLATPGVEAVQFVSKEEAMAVFREEFGEEAELVTDEQFLPASFRVTLRPEYAQADSLSALVAEWEEWARVEEVLYNQPLLVRVQDNLRIYLPVALGVGVLVMMAALFLVGNTIRLTIYARRMLIRTMKLVGATDGFIRQPFLVEGVAQGLVAGVVAGVVLVPLYSALLRWVPQLQVLGWPGGNPVWVVLGVLVFGILLGWFGSWLAVRRFIKGVQLSQPGG